MEGYLNDEEMEEVDPLVDNGDNDLGMMEFDVDNELSDDEKVSLAREGSGEGLEELVEQAFEAGIACVLGEEGRSQAEESEEDAELRHLLLTPLMEHSLAKRLLRGEVLNRALLGTLIQHSMK